MGFEETYISIYIENPYKSDLYQSIWREGVNPLRHTLIYIA